MQALLSARVLGTMLLLLLLHRMFSISLVFTRMLRRAGDCREGMMYLVSQVLSSIRELLVVMCA